MSNKLIYKPNVNPISNPILKPISQACVLLSILYTQNEFNHVVLCYTSWLVLHHKGRFCSQVAPNLHREPHRSEGPLLKHFVSANGSPPPSQCGKPRCRGCHLSGGSAKLQSHPTVLSSSLSFIYSDYVRYHHRAVLTSHVWAGERILTSHSLSTLTTT